MDKGGFVGAVTALQFSFDGSLLYAAIGRTLYLYNTSNGHVCCKSIDVWKQGTIHGIDMGISKSNRSFAVCFGQKQVGLICDIPQNISQVLEDKRTIIETEASDWILDARLLLDENSLDLPNIAIGLSHNLIHIWNPNTRSITHQFQCAERSILYAMGLYGRSIDSLIVAAGTVFQHILLWSPESEVDAVQPAQRLHQHDGVLFHLVWSSCGRFLASVSDDRSVQLWSNKQETTPHTIPRQENLALPFNSQYRAWGHTARVWDVQFSGNLLVSASEDATCKVWGATGNCLATFHGHLDANVWRVAVHPLKQHVIASGGGDSAIKLWDINYEQTNQSLDAARQFNSVDGCTIRNLVARENGLIYWFSDQGHVGVTTESSRAVNLNTNLSCIAGTSEYIVVGDVGGHLTLLSSSTLTVLAHREKAHSGRIMSIWCENDMIFTTGVDLQLCCWRLEENSVLKLLGNYRCPRKTCVASIVLHNNFIWCGDARGNIYAFKFTSLDSDTTESVLFTPLVHGKDVITSMTWHNDLLYTAGHDGYVCTLRYNPSTEQLEILRRVAVKGISTLKSLSWSSQGDLLAFGFHSTNAILFNVTQSLRLFTLDSGGWRRPHSLWLDESSGSHVFGFGLPKSSALHVHSNSVPFDMSRSWHGQHHSKMGCCVAWVEKVEQGDQLQWIVTGGEDGAIKLHSSSTEGIQCVDSVLMHIANIRALSAIQGSPLVVSGGGKQSIHLWRVDTTQCQLVHLVEHTPSDVSQDQRILALAGTALSPDSIAVFTTNSEGQITFFTQENTQNFIAHGTWRVSEKPILSCALSHGYFITGATDGYVVVWDIEQLLKGKRDGFSAMTPVYKYRAHDMGANCLCVRHLTDTTFEIFSGGDDQCIAHAAFDVSDRSNVQVKHYEGRINASGSALKAIQAMGNVVIASGYDQRVAGWQVDNDHTLVWKGGIFSEVADIAGISLRQENNYIHAVVVGKGMQTTIMKI